MPARPCLVCGARIASGSYCRRHTPAYAKRNPRRGSGGKAATFRRRTLAQTGGLCAVCGSDDRVQAHHIEPLAEGGNPQGPGVPLCHRHHAVATRRERELRSSGGRR